MNPLFILDGAWKLLFFMTILSSFYFVFSWISPRKFSFLSSLKKVKALRFSQVIVVVSFVTVALSVFFSDRDLVADCFGQFASREGVFGYTRWMSATWLLGFVVFFSRDLWGYRRILNSLKSSIVAQHEFRWDNKHSLHFQEVSDQWDPMVAGIFRAQVYIPTRLVQNSELLRQVLSHESVHLKNHDNVWNLLSTVLFRLNWFNPLAYFSVKRERLLVEMATDESAVNQFDLDIKEYAQALMSLIRQLQATTPFTVHGAGDFELIQARLLYLKDLQLGKIRESSLYLWFMGVAIVAGFSQAYASIEATPPVNTQAQMCFQVKHELFIESMLMEKRIIEPNKCE